MAATAEAERAAVAAEAPEPARPVGATPPAAPAYGRGRRLEVRAVAVRRAAPREAAVARTTPALVAAERVARARGPVLVERAATAGAVADRPSARAAADSVAAVAAV